MSDYSNMADRLREFKEDLQEGHQQATRRATKDMARATEQTLAVNDSVARGVLKSEIDTNSGPTGGSRLAEESVTTPGWAAYVEHGTGQRGGGTRFDDDRQFPSPEDIGTAMIDNLNTWATRKPVVPRDYESVEDMVWAIAQTIVEEGTYAHPFLRPTWYGPKGYRNVVDANHEMLRFLLRRL